MAKDAAERMNDFIARRTKQAEAKIALAEAQAAADVRAAAADRAAKAAETVLRDQMQGARRRRSRRARNRGRQEPPELSLGPARDALDLARAAPHCPRALARRSGRPSAPQRGAPAWFARSSAFWRCSALFRWPTPRAARPRIRSTERRRRRAGRRSTPISPTFPSATTLRVLSTITGRFAETENTYWGGVHAIAGFERVREIGFRSNGLDYIPRRYCVGRAADRRSPRSRLRSGRRRRRSSIPSARTRASSDGAGASSGASSGFDREHAYAPDCDVLRPIIERRIGVLKASQLVRRIRPEGALLSGVGAPVRLRPSRVRADRGRVRAARIVRRARRGAFLPSRPPRSTIT